MGIKVRNNAFGTLAGGITAASTSITLSSGDGARFPVLGAGDYFFATLIDTSNNLEIVRVTARSGDTLTVVRGQDGTTARAYAVGDRIELRPTAAMFEAFTQADGISYDGTASGLSATTAQGAIDEVVSTSLFRSYLARSSAYTVTAADRGRLIDATSGTWTLTLPVASTVGAGFAVAVRNSGAGVISVVRSGSDTIDGQTTFPLIQRAFVIFVSTGSGWHVFARQSGAVRRVVSLTGATTLDGLAEHTLHACSGTFTVSMAFPPADAGAGFSFILSNSGSGTVTFSPGQGSTVDGQTSIALSPGEGCMVVSTGGTWVTVGRSIAPPVNGAFRTFTFPTSTWNKPAGLVRVKVTVVGGGGGGGSSSTNGSNGGTSSFGSFVSATGGGGGGSAPGNGGSGASGNLNLGGSAGFSSGEGGASSLGGSAGVGAAGRIYGGGGGGAPSGGGGGGGGGTGIRWLEASALPSSVSVTRGSGGSGSGGAGSGAEGIIIVEEFY